jgi:predicted  nucleic acid-binding Zn-ribbon protein
LGDKEHEAQYLTRRKGELEDQILDLLAEVEDREGHLDSSGAILQEMEAAWREEQRHLRGEQEELTGELRDLGAEREKVLASIGPVELGTYEDLRAKKGGLALAALKDGICQGCMVSLPMFTVREVQGRRGLVACGSCGRILYLG